MKRRQFIGVAAAGLLAPSLTYATQQESSKPLNWRCQVVEPLPHNRARRFPVVTDVSIQPRGDLLAIVGDDHYVCIYNRSTKQFVDHLDRHTDWIRTADFSPNGQQLVTAGNDRQLYIWETSNWKSPAVFRTQAEAIFDSAFSPDGSLIAFVGFEKLAHLYSNEGQLKSTFECPCSDMHAVAFSPDGKLLAAGGRSGTIRVWDVASGRISADLPTHRKRIRSLEFLDQNQLVSAGDDQVVRINNLKQPNQSRQLPRIASKLYTVKLIGNGLIATAGSDNKIHIWQTADQTKFGVLQGHTGTVTSLTCHNDILVSGSYDTQVRIWEMQTVTTASQPTPGNGFKLPSRVGRQPEFNGWSRKIN